MWWPCHFNLSIVKAPNVPHNKTKQICAFLLFIEQADTRVIFTPILIWPIRTICLNTSLQRDSGWSGSLKEGKTASSIGWEFKRNRLFWKEFTNKATFSSTDQVGTSFTLTVNITIFAPFKNGFNAVVWCCLHIMLKRSKVPLTKMGT